MGITILFLGVMIILFKFSETEKWWLWTAVVIGLLAQCGYELGSFGLIAAVAVSKVLKDLCGR
jgi:hypothetical protein